MAAAGAQCTSEFLARRVDVRVDAIAALTNQLTQVPTAEAVVCWLAGAVWWTVLVDNSNAKRADAIEDSEWRDGVRATDSGIVAAVAQ